MKILATILVVVLCLITPQPGYPKAKVRCNPANGVARIDLSTAKDLPIRFGRIGKNKDGLILWGSSADAHTQILQKITSHANGTPLRRLKGFIGTDAGRFYIRWKNGSTVPIDSSAFRRLNGVGIASDGNLLMCGYIPPTPTPGDVGRIWVHVKHMGNAVWTIIGIPTGHMMLVDARGDTLRIEPWGCITLGGGPKSYRYSAWAIDKVSKSPPIHGMICDRNAIGVDALGSPRCIKDWYAVDIPVGFQPIKYVAGCSISLPFDF